MTIENSEDAPTNHPNPENPVHPVNPDSDKKQDIPPRPHHEYAREHCAPEEESICRSIIRRAADRPDLDSAKREAQRLVEEFNSYAVNRKLEHRAVVVPDDILTRSLSQRMEAPETYIFDPADYYHLDRDDFYYCLCRGCDECDELDFFIEELKEEYESPIRQSNTLVPLRVLRGYTDAITLAIVLECVHLQLPSVGNAVYQGPI